METTESQQLRTLAGVPLNSQLRQGKELTRSYHVPLNYCLPTYSEKGGELYPVEYPLASLPGSHGLVSPKLRFTNIALVFEGH